MKPNRRLKLVSVGLKTSTPVPFRDSTKPWTTMFILQAGNTVSNPSMLLYCVSPAGVPDELAA
jgi:hypothetical protein